MTEERFKEKWGGSLVGWWAGDADRIFWFRSYHLEESAYLEMCRDFLELYPGSMRASGQLARKVLSSVR
jgi:hypothetical protein